MIRDLSVKIKMMVLVLLIVVAFGLVTVFYIPSRMENNNKQILKKDDLLATAGKGEIEFYVSELSKVSQKFVNIGKDFLNFDKLKFEELDLWEKKEYKLF